MGWLIPIGKVTRRSPKPEGTGWAGASRRDHILVERKSNIFLHFPLGTEAFDDTADEIEQDLATALEKIG